MSKEEIISYIKTEQEKGFSKDQIVDSLVASGWKPSEIDEAYQNLEGVSETASKKSFSFPQLKGAHLIVLIVFVGLLIAGSLGAGAYFLFLKKDPRVIVESSFAKFAQVTSYAYDGSLKADVTLSSLRSSSLAAPDLLDGSETQNISFEMKFQGQLEDILEKEPSTQASFDVDLIESPYGNFRIGFDAMQFGERSFVKVRTLPFFGVDVSPLLNKWVVIEQNDIPQFALTPTPAEDGEIVKKVQSLIALYNFEFEVEDLGKERVGEYTTYHYNVTLDKNNLKGFLMELYKALEDEVLKPDDVAELEDFLSELETASALSFEVFIDIESMYPVRMIFAPKTVPDQSDEFEFDGVLDITFSEFNTDFQLQEPSEYTTFEEVLSEILGGYGYSENELEGTVPDDFFQDQTTSETFPSESSQSPLSPFFNSL